MKGMQDKFNKNELALLMGGGVFFNEHIRVMGRFSLSTNLLYKNENPAIILPGSIPDINHLRNLQLFDTRQCVMYIWVLILCFICVYVFLDGQRIVASNCGNPLLYKFLLHRFPSLFGDTEEERIEIKAALDSWLEKDDDDLRG